MATAVIPTQPRSNRIEVRNPLLTLPSAKLIPALPLEARKAFYAMLNDLAVDANKRAEECWRKKKGPMAAYWKAVSVYAKHTRRLCKRKGERWT